MSHLYHCYHCQPPAPRTVPPEVIGTFLEPNTERAVALLNQIERGKEYYCWCDEPCGVPQCVASQPPVFKLDVPFIAEGTACVYVGDQPGNPYGVHQYQDTHATPPSTGLLPVRHATYCWHHHSVCIVRLYDSHRYTYWECERQIEIPEDSLA